MQGGEELSDEEPSSSEEEEEGEEKGHVKVSLSKVHTEAYLGGGCCWAGGGTLCPVLLKGGKRDNGMPSLSCTRRYMHPPPRMTPPLPIHNRLGVPSPPPCTFSPPCRLQPR